MKTVTTVALVTLLSSMGAMAMTAKAKDENKVVYEVLEGDSSSVQGKRALAVDVKYKSEHVDVGVNAKVNITISTSLSEGVLKVNLRPLKENTTSLTEQELSFTLTKGENSFPINFEVSSEQSGIHYINLTMSVEGKGIKVIAIPVNIGKVTKKLNNKKVEISEGRAISVSSAQEEIQ